MLSVPTNKAISVPMDDNTFFENRLAAAGQNPEASMHGMYVVCGKNSIKPSCPSQLTIFYAGTVNVFDDILPDKAQTIMRLAGNSVIYNASTGQVESGSTNLEPSNGLPANQPLNFNQPISTELQSCLSSPLSVSSYNAAQSAIGSTGTTDFLFAQTIAVSQARKASVTRFLEKRKERLMNAAPYNTTKLRESFNLGSTDSNFPAVLMRQ